MLPPAFSIPISISELFNKSARTLTYFTFLWYVQTIVVSRSKYINSNYRKVGITLYKTVVRCFA